MIFFSTMGVSGCSAPNVKLGPLKICSLEASQGRSDPCINLLSRSWVKVKRRRKLCEGQPLCHSALRCCLVVFLFQWVISGVTGRIPFILSHNIRCWCNLISHPKKLVSLHPHTKITKTSKMGISKTESDIRWRITLQRKFTSTIAALVHYE